MERLAQRDLDALLLCLRELYGYSSDIEAFTSRAISALPEVVRSDSISYNEVNTLSGTISAKTDPPTSEYPPEAGQVIQRHLHEHPLLKHYRKTRDGRALKVSDFLSQRRWHRLALYNEFYKQIRGVEHQMTIIFPAAKAYLIGFALDRSGREDFSERDRLLLDLLRPHLMQARQHAEAAARAQRQSEALRQGLEGSERGLIILSEDNVGRVVWATERAKRWIEEYFEPPRRADQLPESLRGWIEHQRHSLLWGVVVNGLVPPPCEPLVVKRAGKRLVVRLVVADDSEEGEESSRLLVLEEQQQSAPLSAGSLVSLGLTEKEAEILVHAAQGKTNKQIATSLYVSPLTVKKHLEHIYEKLGVENRTEALSRVLKILNLLG
jgi:DNA-binding CsgD family transcriptional regulator